MHYLGYVYGPPDLVKLNEALLHYSEESSVSKERVVVTFPEFQLDSSLLELIDAVREQSNYDARPIVLVDNARDWLENEDLYRLDALVISYDYDAKGKTVASLIVNRGFWDWWVVGGRWPSQFKPTKNPDRVSNIVHGEQVSWVHDNNQLPEGFFSSVLIGDIDWKSHIRQSVKIALKEWETIPLEAHQEGPGYKILATMNIPEGAGWWTVRTKPLHDWSARVREIFAEKIPVFESTFSGLYSDVLVGLSRREVIRYAILRTYVPNKAVFSYSRIDEQGELQPVQEHIDLDLRSGSYPPDEVKKMLKQVRRHIRPDMVVTAVDFHN